MKTVMVVAVLVLANAAGAQTVLPCTSGCPSLYYWETQPCSSGTCARSWAPLPSEFTATTPKGLMLDTPYEGVSLELCAANGQYITGTGTVRVWTWYPWTRSDVSTSKELDRTVAAAFTANACSYTTLSDGGVTSGVGAGDGGTNLRYPCRCVHWTDWQIAGYSSRRVLIEAVDVGVTGGASLEVKLVGLRTRR